MEFSYRDILMPISRPIHTAFCCPLQRWFTHFKRPRCDYPFPIPLLSPSWNHRYLYPTVEAMNVETVDVV